MQFTILLVRPTTRAPARGHAVLMRTIDLVSISDALAHAPRLRLGLALFAFAIAHFLALLGGKFALFSFSDVSVFWPASGVFFAPFFLCRVRTWPWFLGVGIAVDFLFNLTAQTYPLWASVSFSLTSGLEPLLGGIVAYYLYLSRSRRAAVLGAFVIAASAVVSPSLNALIGSAILAELALVKDYWISVRGWWVADTAGILLLTPFIVSWRMRDAQPTVTENRSLPYEQTVIVLITAALTWWIFSGASGSRSVIDQPFALFPVLVWAAARHNPRLVLSLTPLIAIYIIWTTAEGAGPFVSLDTTNLLKVRRIQEYLVLLVVTTMFLTSATWERRRAFLRIQELDQEFRRVARANEAGQMVSAIAHEVSQPLTAAINFIQAARRYLSRDDEESREQANNALLRASDESDRAATVLKNLRSMLERRELDAKPTSLIPVIQGTIVHARAIGKLRDAEVDLDWDEQLPRVLIDSAQITQVLSNIIGNAAEALRDRRGKGWIGIKVERTGEGVKVTISDNGPGIPEDLRERVFEPFATAKSGGMGIGLALCRTIVEAHGGRLWIGDAKEGGAAITMTLPAA